MGGGRKTFDRLLHNSGPAPPMCESEAITAREFSFQLYVEMEHGTSTFEMMPFSDISVQHSKNENGFCPI